MIKTKKIELDVRGMTCDSCAVHVEKALGSVVGVQKVSLPSWELNKAEVILEGEADEQALLQAVEDAGYKASIQPQEETGLLLDIQGMTCESCATHVEQALSNVNGVVNADVPDWQSNQAMVKTKEDVNQLDLLDAVKKAGYQAKIIPLVEESSRNGGNGAGGNWDYDLIVIGTGGGGMAAAIKAADLNFNVAIIEGGEIGGTCVNIGCVPSKTLIRAAEAFHHARFSRFDGIENQPAKLDWKTILREKNELVGKLQQAKYVDVLSAYAENITVHNGWAKLQADGKVALNDGRVFSANKIIIATGARPLTLPIKGVEHVKVLNSTTVMELEKLPKSMIVIGGRAIALELGQAFARFGTKITILQRSGRIIPDHEPELSEALAAYLDQEGVVIHTGVSLTEIKEIDGKKAVTAEIDGSQQQFEAEQILMAVGRVPNTDELGLEALNVELDSSGFIKVNDRMETSNPKIFAVGDVSTSPKYVYVAAAGGGVAASNALSEENKQLDLTSLPEVIFADPQVAIVGLTEKQAEEQGYQVKVSVLPMEYVPRALAAMDTRGLVKLVADVQTDRLLGAHILAPEAGEMIQTATLAIKMGLTIQDLRETLFPYLTNVEAIKLATLAFDKDVAMLSCCAA